MTLVLELPAEVESQLHSEAAARGVAVETVAVERLGASYAESERRAIARSLRGRSTGNGHSVDEFLAERRAEARAEAEKYDPLFASPTPEEIARRGAALAAIGRGIPNRRAEAGLGTLDLSDEADPYGYNARADEQMSR